MFPGVSKSVCGMEWLLQYLETLTPSEKCSVVHKPGNCSFKFSHMCGLVSSVQQVRLSGITVNNYDYSVEVEVVLENIPLLLAETDILKSQESRNTDIYTDHPNITYSQRDEYSKDITYEKQIQDDITEVHKHQEDVRKIHYIVDPIVSTVNLDVLNESFESKDCISTVAASVVPSMSSPSGSDIDTSIDSLVVCEPIITETVDIVTSCEPSVSSTVPTQTTGVIVCQSSSEVNTSVTVTVNGIVSNESHETIPASDKLSLCDYRSLSLVPGIDKSDSWKRKKRTRYKRERGRILKGTIMPKNRGKNVDEVLILSKYRDRRKKSKRRRRPEKHKKIWNHRKKVERSRTSRRYNSAWKFGLGNIPWMRRKKSKRRRRPEKTREVWKRRKKKEKKTVPDC